MMAPQDRRLDPFRNAVWELSRDGRFETYLTCQVIRMRSFPFLWVKRQWLWFHVNWRDGRRGRPAEEIATPLGTQWLSWSNGGSSAMVSTGSSVPVPRRAGRG